ncbi:hypothetical protein JXB22_02685, partial [candidate division WOR-3 bacterium]|nr:hypothetical protein [candidate division WOR-3 bacterium]
RDAQTVCGGGGSAGQRIIVDSLKQAHMVWDWVDYPGQTYRYTYWDARFANGTYYGNCQASPSGSTYPSLDVTRDADPDDQRTVISYSYNDGSGYFAWIDVDAGNVYGVWPNDPRTPAVPDYMWSVISVANNNNILMCTGDYNANYHHLFLTPDQGTTWTNFADFDSCATLSYFLHASKNPGSERIVFVHTQFITDSLASGQIDNDIWYMLSSDNGLTWGPHINLTNYQPDDSVRAYCDPYAIFDKDDNLHIVWSGRRVVDNTYYEASKIFHWDEVRDTITVVSSPSTYYNDPGGWWINGEDGGNYGAWRLPADKPVLISDENRLYCLWTGNDDYADTSAAGYVNGELFLSLSRDNGLTWWGYWNVTNTRTPGAPPGSCDDEDFMCAHPFVVNDSFYILYLEDKDAGVYGLGEGTLTENPIRCLVTPKPLEGIKEQHTHASDSEALLPWMVKGPFHFLRDQKYHIFDITGRQIHTLDPAPGIYFIEVDGEIQQKVIKVR